MSRRGKIIFLEVILSLFLKECKVISKGCTFHTVRIQGFRLCNSSIELVPIVSEFAEVFPKDLPGIPPKREIDFCIDFIPETNPISIPPYWMAPAELKELKSQLKYLLEKSSLDIEFLHGVLWSCL